MGNKSKKGEHVELIGNISNWLSAEGSVLGFPGSLEAGILPVGCHQHSHSIY